LRVEGEFAFLLATRNSQRGACNLARNICTKERRNGAND
jgi:hypothetical protein